MEHGDVSWDSVCLSFFIHIHIREYANEPICIFENQIEGQCLSLILVAILSRYVEHRLRYYLLCFPPLFKIVSWVAMETV